MIVKKWISNGERFKKKGKDFIINQFRRFKDKLVKLGGTLMYTNSS